MLENQQINKILRWNNGGLCLGKVIRKDFSGEVAFKLEIWAMGWVRCSKERKKHVQRACGQKELGMLEEPQRHSCG